MNYGWTFYSPHISAKSTNYKTLKRTLFFHYQLQVLMMVEHLSLCTGQKKEQPWAHQLLDSQYQGCDTGGTPPRLSCSGRKRLRRPSRVRPKVGNSRCSQRLQGKARLPLIFDINRISHFFGNPTYPLPCVDTVILNVGVTRVWTLIAVDPVDGSGK